MENLMKGLVAFLGILGVKFQMLKWARQGGGGSM
jgi:hypothetical protein